MFAFKFEGEIVCEMPTFVITAQKPERVGIPDLERP